MRRTPLSTLQPPGDAPGVLATATAAPRVRCPAVRSRRGACRGWRQAALGLAVLVLAGCGGSAEPAADAGAGSAQVAAKDLVSGSADALTRHFRSRLEATKPGVSSGDPVRYAFLAAGRRELAVLPSLAPATGAVMDSAAATGTSSTLLQEAGVGEGDVVATDADLVLLLGPWPSDPVGGAPVPSQTLQLRRALGAGAQLIRLAEHSLAADARYDQVLLDRAGRRAAVLGAVRGELHVPPGLRPAAQRARIELLDYADPLRPVVAARADIDGSISAARTIGGTLWLVVTSLPQFDGFDWAWSDPTGEPNRRYLERLSAADVLPRIAVDGRPAQPLVAERDCLLQPAAPGWTASVVTLVAIDLASGLQSRRSRCFAGWSETVYMTERSLYLATTRYPQVVAGGDVTAFASTAPVTDIHKFDIGGSSSIAYRGSGSAAGTLGWGNDSARFRMSERGGDLRVVTSLDTGDPAGVVSPARLTVLRDAGPAAGLQPIAMLPNERRTAAIGKPGEQVHGVRFVGDRAYVVTFRRTDPLYVVDLSVADDPKLSGALVVPGFSDRLYPLGDRLLLGVGHDSQTFDGIDLVGGVLVSLIDVTDPDQPRELARRVIGQRGSRSAADDTPHGVSIRPVGDGWRVSLPVTVHDTVVPGQDDVKPPWRSWAYTQVAAYRFLVDGVTRRWTEAPPVIASAVATVPGWSGLVSRSWNSVSSFDRSFDAGDTCWLWVDGQLASGRW